MYNPFQEYIVKKGQIVCLFLIEWLEIQATLMQAIQCILLKPNKDTVSETQNGMFSFKSYCWILDSK